MKREEADYPALPFFNHPKPNPCLLWGKEDIMNKNKVKTVARAVGGATEVSLYCTLQSARFILFNRGTVAFIKATVKMVGNLAVLAGKKMKKI